MSVLRHTEQIPEALRSCPPALILTAHGSADPRSSATTHQVAGQIRRLRPSLDVREAFCEHNEPNLRDVLASMHRPALVTPLLLASAYHARIDIPAMIDEAKVPVLQADTLGEDPRLVSVLSQRLTELELGADGTVGVLVVAVGSSHKAANARTATVAAALFQHGWPRVRVAFATAQPTVADGIAALRRDGAKRIAVAPWFIAPGKITDRVAEVATELDAVMAEPLGTHPLLAHTVLDRFDQAMARQLAA